jgi:SSS family solute:Na+ symporter
MPILSAFITGLLFRNMDARAAIAGLVWGVALYAFHNFILYVPDTLYAGETFYQHMGIGWLHYIDVMAIVLVTCVLTALTVNRIIFGNRAVFIWSKEGRRLSAIEA